MAWTTPSYTNAGGAAQAYARVALETGVASSDPRRLLVMLYDGVLKCLAQARGHMQRRDAAAKGAALGQALKILGEGLIASLDEENGGPIARQLRDLYDYIEQRIVLANLRNDARLLDEAVALLTELRAAWQTLAERPDPAQKAA
jgi:flagellar protein FliS